MISLAEHRSVAIRSMESPLWRITSQRFIHAGCRAGTNGVVHRTVGGVAGLLHHASRASSSNLAAGRRKPAWLTRIGSTRVAHDLLNGFGGHNNVDGEKVCSMNRHLSRRRFFQDSILLGTGVWLGTQRQTFANSPNEKLNLAFIGVGGRGGQNLNEIMRNDESLYPSLRCAMSMTIGPARLRAASQSAKVLRFSRNVRQPRTRDRRRRYQHPGPWSFSSGRVGDGTRQARILGKAAGPLGVGSAATNPNRPR